MADLSIPLQGMLRVEMAVDAIAGQMARPPATLAGSPAQPTVAPQDTVDLSAATVALAESRVIYAIDARSVQVLDSINQSLLDVMG